MQFFAKAGKSVVFKLMAVFAGIAAVAGLGWTGLLLSRSPDGILSGGIICAGILILGFALSLQWLALETFLRRPLLEVCMRAWQAAREKFPEKAIKSGEDEIGRLNEIISEIHQVLEYKGQMLAQEHSEYQNLFETVPCLITVQDRNLRLIRYNREFARKFDPRQGDYCYSVYKKRERKCENCPVEKTFRDGEIHTFEEAGYSRDGKPIWWVARTAPIMDENGRVVAAMEMSLDVTIKRQLEEKLEASQRRYQAIFSNIPNPVFVLDPGTMEILDCNDAVEAVYGYRQTELKGRSFLEFFDKEQRDVSARQIHEEAFIHQIRQFDKQGNTLFVDIRSARTTYPEWEVLLVTTSDITQQLETEQQLIQASKMTTLGEMATGIAHELNQPLSVMKTASNFMLKKFGAGSEVDKPVLEKMLNKIDANVDRASNIIGHMRQFARKTEMDLERVDVNHVLEMASQIFSEQLKVRGIDVQWNMAENLTFIRANPSRLEQVFVNILINARDAIEEKWGDLRAGPEQKVITVTTTAGEKSVIVEICDTGNGIAGTVKDKIFEPFFTTKPVGSGTGLGLSISYGIVRECGGTINARNKESGGACFTLKFPVYEKTRQQGF